MSTTSVFRVKWKRVGWSSGRFKASPIFPSKRGALAEVRKLEHATKQYMLQPIEELYMEEGTVHWSPHRVSLPDALQEHTQPLVDDVWVKRWMDGHQDLKRKPTIAEVNEFRKLVEES